MLSRQENLTPYLYSKPWQTRKTAPSKIVAARNQKKCLLLPFRMYACAAVIVAPELRSNKVLTRGRPHALSAWVPVGGQIVPPKVEGARLKWKNAQKKAKKSITSEIIKRIIPSRRPDWTFLVWNPWRDSARIARNHCMTTPTIAKNPRWTINGRENPGIGVPCI